MQVQLISGIELMQRATSATIDREVKPSLAKMLHAEHSPIRSIMFEVDMIVPSFVSVHFVRHSATGQQHFVSTKRDDRGGTGKEDRNTPVSHKMILNAQHIIDISRKRLCSKSHKETVKAWKQVLLKVFEIMPELELVCMPQCMYRGGTCYEFSSCGMAKHYLDK